jgi:hypothetical protein
LSLSFRFTIAKVCQINDLNRRIEADAAKDLAFVTSIKENAVSSDASKTALQLCLAVKGDGCALPIANVLVVPWAMDGYALLIANALVVPWAKDGGYELPTANDPSFSAVGVASAPIPRCSALHQLVENSSGIGQYQTKQPVG